MFIFGVCCAALPLAHARGVIQTSAYHKVCEDLFSWLHEPGQHCPPMCTELRLFLSGLILSEYLGVKLCFGITYGLNVALHPLELSHKYRSNQKRRDLEKSTLSARQ